MLNFSIKTNKSGGFSMPYVIKVSKLGFSVSDLSQDRKIGSDDSDLSHLRLALALPYLLGAEDQVERYKEAIPILGKHTIKGIYKCLHEISTLFEDLSTVAKYMEKCGYKYDTHQLWFDIRNHIRHDIREEFNLEDNKKKNDRALRLGLDHKLQMDISFDIDYIIVGETKIEIKKVIEYLEWSKKIVAQVLSSAEKNGYIGSIKD